MNPIEFRWNAFFNTLQKDRKIVLKNFDGENFDLLVLRIKFIPEIYKNNDRTILYFHFIYHYL